MVLLDISTSIPGALGTFFLAVGGFITATVKALEWHENRRRRRAAAAVPTEQHQLPPSNPFGRAPLTDPALLHRLDTLSLENAVARSRWTIDDLRAELDQAGRDHAKTAAALTAERGDKARLISELDAERHKVASLSVRLAALEAELDARTPTDRPPKDSST